MKLHVVCRQIPIPSHGPYVSLFPGFFSLLLAPDTTIDNPYTHNVNNIYVYISATWAKSSNEPDKF